MERLREVTIPTQRYGVQLNVRGSRSPCDEDVVAIDRWVQRWGKRNQQLIGTVRAHYLEPWEAALTSSPPKAGYGLVLVTFRCVDRRLLFGKIPPTREDIDSGRVVLFMEQAPVSEEQARRSRVAHSELPPAPWRAGR